jgi:hypothetical protein
MPPGLVVVRGWPGVGKTTLASVLAHDPELAEAFADGILWTSLGPTPDVTAHANAWLRALGANDPSPSARVAQAQLAAHLRDKRALLIIDDAWEPEHATSLLCGGVGCAALVTTRARSVAFALAPTPESVYRLEELSAAEALELLRMIAPAVVSEKPQAALMLVKALEGLPLAVRVSGRLLMAEMDYGFGVDDLLCELEEGQRLLHATAPVDRLEPDQEVTPTVALLLRRSTDKLDPQTRDCFALLGAFAPKPATFDEEAMRAVWAMNDARPVIRALVDRGLLEFIAHLGRYQMHAVLAMHARSLLE